MFNTKNTQFFDYFYEGEHLCIYPWGHGPVSYTHLKI